MAILEQWREEAADPRGDAEIERATLQIRTGDPTAEREIGVDGSRNKASNAHDPLQKRRGHYGGEIGVAYQPYSIARGLIGVGWVWRPLVSGRIGFWRALLVELLVSLNGRFLSEV